MSDTEAPHAADDRFDACLRLAAQMHALSGLYQGVVHDLKSPLNALVVNLELLRATLDPESPLAEKQERYARVLHEELMRLNRSIETLLPAAAPFHGEPERFDLRELTDEVTTFVSPQARQQRVTVDAHTGDEGGPPVPVHGIRDHLKQALLAVVINALEAMPDGGTLTVETGLTDGVGRVSVIDTGSGIPAEIRGRLFDLYASTKDGHPGIGLYVARQVVESTNGSISVPSGIGQGARFDVELPLAA